VPKGYAASSSSSPGDPSTRPSVSAPSCSPSFGERVSSEPIQSVSASSSSSSSAESMGLCNSRHWLAASRSNCPPTGELLCRIGPSPMTLHKSRLTQRCLFRALGAHAPGSQHTALRAVAFPRSALMRKQPCLPAECLSLQAAAMAMAMAYPTVRLLGGIPTPWEPSPEPGTAPGCNASGSALIAAISGKKPHPSN